MSNIDTRAPFFPNSKTAKHDIEQAKEAASLRRNSYERSQQLKDIASRDAKVTIPETIKDFSQIKRVADTTPDVDNTDKIAALKAQIQAGTYQPDYDAIADKILASEY